jgi:hypothetical protein
MDELQNLELAMADFVKQQAPEDVQEFIEAITENGVTQEEVDEVRAITTETLTNPDNFPRFVQYLVAAQLIEQEDAPQTFEVGFVLSILGLVGVAQENVTTG